jgi:AraC-like DNA-binding protein
VRTRGLRAGRDGVARDVRVGPLLGVPTVLAGFGLDAARQLADTGLPRDLFDDPDHRAPFAATGRLLALCADRARCPHFGLLVGEHFTVRDLGVLGILMRHSPTLRDALRHGVHHLELQDRGAVALTLHLGESEVALGYSIFASGMPGVTQVLDLAITVCFRILRELCGPSWRPLVVRLSHRRPARIGPYKRAFGAAVDFDAAISAVVFDERWLDYPIAGADRAVFAATMERVRAVEATTPTPFVDGVRQAIGALLYTGSASTASLANLFGLHERALRRRLAVEGATVRSLVNEAREELARHLLRDTTLAVSEVAGVLRYSSVTAFCRAFRAQSGRSPQAWRAEATAGR